jgi:iron complex outermembrane receptor protein
MITLTSSVLALSLFARITVVAQTDTSTVRDTVYNLSPVIISATQARERETPATFSNISQEQLEQRYSTQDIPVLLGELPSTTFYSENGNGIGYNYINLRGFDQRRISVMINGVPQNDPEDHNVYWIDFPDLLASIDNIQVQRGAGSAFYGPPAIGGSINLITNPFARSPGITIDAMYGFQEFGADNATVLNTRKYAAAVNSGLVDQRYMFYAKLGKLHSEGYRLNSWVDMNSYFLGAIRFDDNVTTRVHFFGGPIADGLAYFGLPRFVNSDNRLRRHNLVYWELDSSQSTYSFMQERRPQEVENFSQPHYELLTDWRISPSLQLHNTLFFYTGDGSFDYDASWADTSMLRMGSAYGIPTRQNPSGTLVRAFVGNRQWGWLPRIEISHANGTLTLGAELRVHRSLHWGKIQFAEGLPENFDPDYHFYEYQGEKEILSAFVHELYRLNESTTVMADVQFVHNRYGISHEKYLQNEISIPYFFVNPRVGLNTNLTSEWNAYISLTHTLREPRLRNLYAAEDSYYGATPQFAADTSGGVARYDFGQPFAKPERLLNLELGAIFQNARGRFAANVFWMEFVDELVKSGQVDIFGQPVTGNAERTRHVGVEFDGSATLSSLVTISGNVAFSRNRLVRYTTYERGVPDVLDGNPIAGFPDILGNVRLTFTSNAFTASLIGKFVGAFYTDNFKNDRNRNDEYTVVNLETLYDLPTVAGTALTLRGEVRNVLNNLYCTSGEGPAFFPAAERNYLVGIRAKL